MSIFYYVTIKIARKFTESIGAYRDKVFLDENIIPQRLTLSEKGNSILTAEISSITPKITIQYFVPTLYSEFNYVSFHRNCWSSTRVRGIFLCAKSLFRFILSDCCLCSSEQFELSSAEYINTLKLLTVLKKVCEEEQFNPKGTFSWGICVSCIRLRRTVLDMVYEMFYAKKVLVQAKVHTCLVQISFPNDGLWKRVWIFL